MKGKITVLFNRDGMTIEVVDSSSLTKLIKIEVDAAATLAAMSRLALVPCTFELQGVENVGKIIERDNISFEMPPHNEDNMEKVALEIAEKLCPDGWQIHPYLGGRDNWFYEKNKLFCRCHIFRYVISDSLDIEQESESSNSIPIIPW